MARLALEYRRAVNERERGQERPREAIPQDQERHDSSRELDPRSRVIAISVCVEIVETPHAD